jgi:hypothetical protein
VGYDEPRPVSDETKRHKFMSAQWPWPGVPSVRTILATTH